MSTYRDEVFEERICRDCENSFEITVSEKEYFERMTDEDGQPMSLPKRCKTCRSRRRMEKQKNNYQ
jgi:hypothetical protein